MVTIEISDELYQRLAKQVQGFETPSQVIERLLGYVEQNTQQKAFIPDELEEIARVKRKVPKWLKSQHQICSQILITFLALSKTQQQRSISVESLKEQCLAKGISEFQINFRQMSRIYAKNHAKVFEEKDGMVSLWEPVRAFVLQQGGEV